MRLLAAGRSPGDEERDAREQLKKMVMRMPTSNPNFCTASALGQPAL
jgi:hypothetical protein